MRSWLIVPADSAPKLAKAAALDADAMIVDLHADGAETGQGARALVADWFASTSGSARRFERWLRIAPLSGEQWREQLAAVMKSGPDGVVMTGVEDADEVRRMASELYELEQRHGVTPHSVRLVLQLGSSARGAIAIPALVREPHPRLAGIAWDPVALARDIGAEIPGGARWPAPLAHVRSQVLLGAKALGRIAIEAAYRDWRDGEGFAEALTAARRDGFDAMTAVHPAQIAPINQTFASSAEELAEAREIVALFDKAPGSEILPFRGRMIDRAQLHRARRMLATA